MKTKNGLFADVPHDLWSDWTWQVANRIETVEQLREYICLTQTEERGIEKCLSAFRMAITPYYLSLIDLDDPYDPIRRQSIPTEDELYFAPCMRRKTRPCPASRTAIPTGYYFF